MSSFESTKRRRKIWRKSEREKVLEKEGNDEECVEFERETQDQACI